LLHSVKSYGAKLMVEGEFKKRIRDLELDDYPYKEREETSVTEDLFNIINEAHKEFPKKKERSRVRGDGEEYEEEYYDVDEVDGFLKKWFGIDPSQVIDS
jgi:hypothetical protein